MCQVLFDDIRRGANARDPTRFQQYGPLAEVCDDGKAVRNDQDRFPLATGCPHFPHAFLLKGGVSNSQNFIHDQDFRLKMGRHGKSQPNIHSAGITFDGGVEEFFDFGKRDNFVELASNFTVRHAEDRTVQVNVFAPG